MRKKIVAGNWKMHGSRTSVTSLLRTIRADVAALNQVEIIVFPSFIHLPIAEEILDGSNISWGAQNLYLGDKGAFTGEISAPMLLDYGCKYVLIGHSERRMFFHDDFRQVVAKFKAALQFGLQPILCVGETLAEREEGKAETILVEQLDSVIAAVGIAAFKDAVIAYEPVWAIGTGLTATPEQAQAMHALIRSHLAQYEVDVASTVRILYGGSVKADNAHGLFAMPNIDGGLVGGASLDANAFAAICMAAN